MLTSGQHSSNSSPSVPVSPGEGQEDEFKVTDPTQIALLSRLDALITRADDAHTRLQVLNPDEPNVNCFYIGLSLFGLNGCLYTNESYGPPKDTCLSGFNGLQAIIIKRLPHTEHATCRQFVVDCQTLWDEILALVPSKKSLPDALHVALMLRLTKLLFKYYDYHQDGKHWKEALKHDRETLFTYQHYMISKLCEYFISQNEHTYYSSLCEFQPTEALVHRAIKKAEGGHRQTRLLLTFEVANKLTSSQRATICAAQDDYDADKGRVAMNTLAAHRVIYLEVIQKGSRELQKNYQKQFRSYYQLVYFCELLGIEPGRPGWNWIIEQEYKYTGLPDRGFASRVLEYLKGMLRKEYPKAPDAFDAVYNGNEKHYNVLSFKGNTSATRRRRTFDGQSEAEAMSEDEEWTPEEAGPKRATPKVPKPRHQPKAGYTRKRRRDQSASSSAPSAQPLSSGRLSVRILHGGDFQRGLIKPWEDEVKKLQAENDALEATVTTLKAQLAQSERSLQLVVEGSRAGKSQKTNAGSSAVDGLAQELPPPSSTTASLLPLLATPTVDSQSGGVLPMLPGDGASAFPFSWFPQQPVVGPPPVFATQRQSGFRLFTPQVVHTDVAAAAAVSGQTSTDGAVPSLAQFAQPPLPQSTPK